MNKFSELLNQLNELKIIQKHGDWDEDMPDEIYEAHFKNNFHTVTTGLDVDTHRWYETSIEVIKIYDKFMGIRYITNLFSESSEYEDCYHTIEFFEMKEVTITSYTPI